MNVKRVLMAATIGLSGCWTTSCVARGTVVSTPDGLRPVESIEIGDLVYSVDEVTGEWVATAVTFIQSAVREVGSLTVKNTTLRMTSDHPVYDPVARRYAPAGDWFLGERTALYLCEEGIVELDDAAVFVETTEVFDIGVESELHNFVANGILVHNKSPADPGCSDEFGSFRYQGEGCDQPAPGTWRCPNGENSPGVCEPFGDDVSTSDATQDFGLDLSQPDMPDPFALPDGYCCCEFLVMDIQEEDALLVDSCASQNQGQCIDVDPNRLTPHPCCPNATGERCGPG